METHEKDREVSQSTIKMMKMEMEANREKEKRVVEIVRMLESEKRSLELELNSLKSDTKSSCVTLESKFGKEKSGGEIEHLKQKVQAL